MFQSRVLLPRVRSREPHRRVPQRYRLRMRSCTYPPTWTLGEYCLAKLIGLQVIDALNPAATQAMGHTKLPGVEAELKDPLSIVANYRHEDNSAAQCAYVLGLREVLPEAAIAYAPPNDWVLALDRALPKLDLLAPAGKELVVRTLTQAISADGIVSGAECELLRTVCAALHCPLPPLLQHADCPRSH